MQLKSGTVLQNGKYRIVKTLGQGGFGITYEAEQVLLRRKIALKEFFMKDCCERDESTSRVTVGTGSQRALVEKFRGKFIREAQMMAGLDHPNVVRVTDVFEENETAYYVMENLPGGSLADKVRKEGPLSEDLAEKYIRQVAEGLSYIHSQNIVHLDVKPSNILLNAKGNAVLIDFGISKHYDEAGEQTSSTPVGISKGYAPLEQGREGDVSQFMPSTDIYALGATLYYLVTGTVPPGASIVNEDGLTRPNGVSDRIWHTIGQAMQPRRKDRPQSVADFLSLLDKETRPAPARVGTPSSFSDETVIAGKNPSESRPKSEPKPELNPTSSIKSEPKPAPSPVSKPTSEKKKSKTWLWALLGGVAVAAIVIAVVLGGSGNSVEYPSTGTLNGHSYTDLGLSVKWATCNVGASSPSDYGNYYAWGETGSKSEYSWMNYRFRVSGNSYDNVTFSWYNMQSDNRTTLDLSDDTACQNWGGSWRMPTDAEWKELIEGCTWTWTKQGGKKGYKVTSKTNGNSIFLPAAGNRNGGSLYDAGSYGLYWSSSLSSDYSNSAWYVYFNSSGVYRYYGGRYDGFSVRPVSE